MQLTFNTNELFHPLADHVPILLEIVQGIQQREYSFDPEIEEVRKLTPHLEEAPEDDVAGFNTLYSVLQAYQSRTASIMFSVLQEKAWWIQQLHHVKRSYKRARAVLLHTRPEIKELRNKELQDAAISEEINEIVQLMSFLEDVIEDLELTVELLQVKQTDLEKANTNLSRQQKIVESLIGLGDPVRARRQR